jgi:hypothetical protein
MDYVTKPKVASFRECLARCDQIEPGICEEDSDYSLKKTTQPEVRVAQQLAALQLANKNLLHVGVGNSQIAARMASQLARIDGITLMPNEKRRGDDLMIANYSVLLANKYAPNLAGLLPAEYDFIIDVNLASFCCCQFHFDAMMKNFAAILKSSGLILTDIDGMLWIQKGVDRRWLLDYDDLVWIGREYGLVAVALDDTVFGLQKPAGAA